jgi:hypothetical protein
MHPRSALSAMDAQSAGRATIMSETITEPPTSTAATQETEPEVVAAISSGEGDPNLPTAFRVGTFEVSPTGLALLLAAGFAIGFGAVWMWQRR